MAVTVIPNEFGNAFSHAFAQAQILGERDRERKRQEEDLRKSLEVISGTNTPLPDNTTMQPTAVQTPVGLAGQSGIATQPSAPVAEIPPVQTQTTTASLPQVDPYKDGLKSIELNYREKMKNLSQIRDPRLAMQYVSQAMQERDLAKAEHNSATFQTGLMEIMNADMTPAQKIGKALQLNGQLKAGFKVPEIVKMFETPKPIAVAPGTTFLDPTTMKPIYTAPNKESTATTWGPIQYDPQGKAYQTSSRNEVKPLPNYDKPPKESVGNLSPDEEKRFKILKEWVGAFEKKKENQTVTGAFDPDKAAEHPEYDFYNKSKSEYDALLKKSLEPKATKTETARVISPAQIMAIKSTLVTAAKQSNKPIPSDAEMDAYIKKNYTVTEETP